MSDSDKRSQQVREALKQIPNFVKEKQRRYRKKMKIRKLFEPVVKQILEIQKNQKSSSKEK